MVNSSPLARAQVLKPFLISLGREDEARRALIGFHEDAGQAAAGVRPHNVVEQLEVLVGALLFGLRAEGAAVEVGERGPDHARHGRAVAAFRAGQAAHRCRGVGPAVETALKTEDLKTARLPLHDANGRLRGLAAGREEEALVHVRRQRGGQLFGRQHAILGGTLVVVQQLLGRLADGLHQMRMGVADVRHQHAAGPIEERVAVDVGDDHAAAVVPNHLGLVAGGVGLDSRPAFDEFVRFRAGNGCLYVGISHGGCFQR